MKAELYGFRAGADEMGAAEGGEEIIESVSIGQVDDRETQTPLVTVAVEQVVVANGQVKEMAGRNARRISVVIFGSGGGNG